MPMNARLLRPIASGVHPEAAAWRSAVVAAGGGTPSAATMRAVSKLCADIDAAGIRDRFYRLGIMAGPSLTAALVPLYRGTSRTGTQYGGTTDTNVGPFVSGDYAETGASGGLTGNGSSKYLTTGLTTAALPSLSTGHLSAYAMTGFSTASAYGLVASFSSGFVGTNYYGIESNAGNVSGTMSGSWGAAFSGRIQVTAANGAGIGFVGVSRVSSTDSRVYRNGAQIGSTQTNTVTTNANDGGGFSVFASLAQTGAIAFAAAVRLGGYSIGSGLSDAQMASYNTAMQAFQTALGRNV